MSSKRKKLYYYYHFAHNENTRALVKEMNQFAIGEVNYDCHHNESYARIHCKHSCEKFKSFGAFARRGEYIVYDDKGHLYAVMSEPLFRKEFGVK